MLITAHFIVGSAIASKVLNPAISFPLALGSHFLLDRIPHWNPHLLSEFKKYNKITRKTTFFIFIDSSLAISSAAFISLNQAMNFNQALIVFLSGVIATAPDLIEAPYYFLNMKSRLVERWILWQKTVQGDASFVPGILIQIVIITTSILWILS